MRLAADGRRIPDQFAVFFRRIAPRRLAGGEPLLNGRPRFAEQNRNVLLRVQTVADEKRHDDQIFRLREPIAFGNARVFFKENRVDAAVKIQRADQFHLPLDRLARIFVFLRAVAGDEQRDLRRLGRAREREICSTISRARDRITPVMLSCEPTGLQ